ncbi:MAG: InlB B-repeat-containing protein [Lachnospiraceae bacterium]|nr:InlB B-repeat-containing protein [Lachnospiraceae bacterium]
MTKMKRRIRLAVSMLLCVVLMTGLIPESLMGTLFVHAAPETDGNWSDYTTAVEPGAGNIYRISSAAELAWVADLFNVNEYDEDYSGATFMLTADIDLSAHYWIPIGKSWNKKFNASFDGNGHTVSGLRVGSQESPYNAELDTGFFGIITGTVRNLKITDAKIYAEHPNGTNQMDSGLLAGRMNGATAINCEADGSIYTGGVNSKRNATAGGIVGEMSNSAIIDSCRVSSAISLTDAEGMCSLGGIAGIAGYLTAVTINNCVSDVTISVPAGTDFANVDSGPLCGNGNSDNKIRCTVRNSIVRADLGGSKGYSGAIESYGSFSLRNVCWIETNFKLLEDSSYVAQSPRYDHYALTKLEVTHKTEADMKDSSFVATLNSGTSGIDGALSWSIDENINGGFPNLADAGITETEIIYHTVSFVSMGTEYTSASVESGQAVSKPADPPAEEGKIFQYWYAEDASTPYDFSSAITADLTLTAKWKGVEYTVRFDSRGGSYVYPQTVEAGTAVILPQEPVKKGYAFGGWYTDSACTSAWNFDTAAASDMTLYAMWTEASDVAVSGRITDVATGEGIRNAIVTLSGGKNATTDEFGYYRISDVSAGSYTITARAFGYNDASEEGFTVGMVSAGFDAALTKTAGGGAGTVNIYATISCVYSGIMLDGVEVKAVGEGNLGSYTQTTADGGLATFTGIPAGKYTFKVNHLGRAGWEKYTSETKDLTGDYQLSCALKPNYQSLKIKVIGSFDPVSNKSNMPLKGKTVTLTGVDPSNEENELIHIDAYTDADGSVTVDKLVPITWKVSCSDYAYEQREATVYSDSSGKLSGDEVTLTLPFVDSSLAVSFTSVYSDTDIFKKTEDNDHPLDVLLTGVAGTMTEGIIRNAIPDSSGKAIFTGLFPGSYMISASGRSRRLVAVKGSDGLDIFDDPTYSAGHDFSRFGKKHFDVEFNGNSTASVALGMRASTSVKLDAAMANFSGVLYKTDMDANGELVSTPCANTKIWLIPSFYYPLAGVEDGYSTTTDAQGHYSISLTPGLYGVEVREAAYKDYFGGRLTYHSGNTDGYTGAWGWPCAEKWGGNFASAVSWMTSDENGAYGDIGGMSLSSGTVVADLEMMEEQISYSACSPDYTVDYDNLTWYNLMIGCERDETITTDSRTTVRNNYDYYKNTYKYTSYHPDTRGAVLKLKGKNPEVTVTMTDKSFPYLFNELSPGNYGLEYTISNDFSELESSVSWGGNITFFDFPSPGKLPEYFPEDYAENGNPWPLSTKYSGLKIEAKKDHNTFRNIHDRIKFKFFKAESYAYFGDGGIEQSDYEQEVALHGGEGSDLLYRNADGTIGNAADGIYPDEPDRTKIEQQYLAALSDGATNEEKEEAMKAAYQAYLEQHQQWEADKEARGFPKEGCRFEYISTQPGWRDNYEYTSNYLFEEYLVGYSTSKIPDKMFYYQYTVNNRTKPLPDGTVTLYFCAPRGKAYVFLGNMEYIRNREVHEDLYNSDLWFSVTLDNSSEGDIYCNVNFLNPDNCSSNVHILTKAQVDQLLNPRTIAVQAVDRENENNVIDSVDVTITYAGRNFSSASPTAFQTCNGSVTVVQLAAGQKEWEYHEGDAVKSVYDAGTKTETFYVPLRRVAYSKELLIKDEKGNPVQNAFVSLVGKSHGQPVDVITNAAGKATASDLYYQDYNVYVISPGYSPTNITLIDSEIISEDTKSISLTRYLRPDFTQNSVKINRKGAFIPGVSFTGSTSSVDFLVDLALTKAKDSPLYYTVEAALITPPGDGLWEVYLVDKKSFKNADFSDIPTALATPAMDNDNYNPSEALSWLAKLTQGGQGNVYVRSFSNGGSFTPKSVTSGNWNSYEISATLPLWELPPDGFDPCLVAVTSNYAVQIYDFDYSGENEKNRLVGTRLKGDSAAMLNNITLMANAKSLGGAAVEKLAELVEPTGSIIPLPSFEAKVSMDKDGFLTYNYTVAMRLMQGRKSVSDAEKSYMSVLPSTLGACVSGGWNMALDGKTNKLSNSFDVGLSSQNLTATDYLPSLFSSLPVKVEFDKDNPPSGKFSMAYADTRDKNNTSTREEYSFEANGQVHIVAQVSAFSSVAALLPVGPILASLEKSGALDIGAQVKVSAGADGTYTYTIVNGVETGHDVTFTIGAGAGLGIYAKALGGALGAEANVRLSGDNPRLANMVTVDANIDKDGFHMRKVDGKVVADAHIEIKTWFINGEKDFTFAEIPFSYQFGTETQFSLTPIEIVDNIKSRDDFGVSTFNGQPESIVSNLLPIGGYATDEDGSGTFVYTDMSAKGGKVRLQFASNAGGATWNKPVTIAATDGLIPAFDVISLADGYYLAVWSEIAKADMMNTCPPSFIKYSLGKVSGNAWSGSIKNLNTLPAEVASKLLLVSDSESIYLATLKTAEGPLAGHLSISSYKYNASAWSGETLLAKEQETYSIAACVKGGELFVSYATADNKLHVKRLGASVSESVFDAAGFETAMAANETNAYLVYESAGGLMLSSLSGSRWSAGTVIADIADAGNPSVIAMGSRVAVSYTGGNDKSLYTMVCGADGTVLKQKTELKTTTDRFSDGTTVRNDNKIMVFTIVDGLMDQLNVYVTDGYEREQAIVNAVPKAVTGLISTGSALALITPGSATGGRMYYAVTTDENAPAESLYSSVIPVATEAGTYYVWYKVVGDVDHYDSAAAYIKVVIEKNPAEPEEPEEPVTPAVVDIVHAINVTSGAVAKNSKGEEVKTARENEEISIFWIKKEGYEFVNWELTGAVPYNAVSENTAFRMGSEEVIVAFEEKLMIEDQVNEELPEDADTTTIVKALKFEKSKLILQRKAAATANPVMVKARGTAPEVVYVTENKDIVAVDKSGNFWPTGVGEATVTAYCGNKKATCKVTVVSYTEDIIIRDINESEVTGKTLEMKSGEQAFLTVSFEPYDSTDPRNVRWKSDSKKVSVKNGLITAKEVNEAVSAKVTASVKCTDPETGKTSELSRTVTVNVKPVEVAKVSSADKSHTLKLGKSKIALNTSDAEKASAELAVNIKSKSDASAIKIVSITSTNNDVVSVNKVSDVTADGKKGSATVGLQANAAGVAYIIVKTSGTDGNVNIRRCKVTVSSPAKAIVIKSGTLNVENKTMTLRKGTSGTIEIKLDPEYSTDHGKVKISGKGITIKNGIISAKKITKTGKPATITVKCGKLKETISVTVTK